MGAGPAESELFSWPSAQLFLVEGALHKALLQSGPFSMLLTTHARCPHLALVEAAVADLRWPVGKDSFVTIFHSPSCPPAARFLFVFPGCAKIEQLVYELHLLDTCASPHNNADISRLQTLLQLYASLRASDTSADLYAGPPAGSMKELEESAGKYWARVAAEKGGSDETNGKVDDSELGCRKEEDEQEVVQLSLGLRSVGSRHGSSSSSSPPCTVSAAISCAPGISKRMMKRIQKARRVSAVAKLLSKAMARGMISGKAHVVEELAAGRGGEARGWMQKVSGDRSMRPAVAKVEAITRVVEAVERGAAEDGDEQQQERQSSGAAASRSQAVKTSANLATWTLNEVGLQLLVNVVVAANLMQSAGKASLTTSSSSSSLNSSLLHNKSRVYSGASPPASSSGSLPPSRHRPPRPPSSTLLSEASSPFVLNSSSYTLSQS